MCYIKPIIEAIKKQKIGNCRISVEVMKMFLSFRNTYKTRKIMLLYAFIAIISMTLGLIPLGLLFIYHFWWLYVITGLLYISFFFFFFLLVLENNNYNIKYYYSKKKFKKLYNDIISKYNIGIKKYKNKIKRIAKDLFYQFGSIDEKNIEIRLAVFDYWLEKQSMVSIKDVDKENSLDFFLYILLAGATNSNAFKIYLKKLSDIYNKECFEQMLNRSPFIKDVFKEKCMFIYDNPSFISDSLLDTIYIETLLIVQGNIGILSITDFENIMYNPSFYYSEDKKIAYSIIEEDDIYNVYEKNIAMDYEIRLERQCENKEDALKAVEENLKIYEKTKLDKE